MATNFDFDNNELEKFTLIWLDAAINGNENRQTQNDLQKLTDQFKIFDDIEKCELYIHSLAIDERIVFIVSGQLGREIVPRIHEIKQISSIYIYCFNKTANKEWTKYYSKIKD